MLWLRHVDDHKAPAVERIHLGYCKNIMKLKSSTCNVMMCYELGIVISSVKIEEQTEKLMKSKRKSKHTRDYKKVYIADELTIEARIQLANMMTVLAGNGREKYFVSVNGKIQNRGNNTRGKEPDNPKEEIGYHSMEDIVIVEVVQVHADIRN
ncbi:unnamed protein product [Mytilus coruscus]|uniref:Uncharacterized protein n=1 Tax=Mytilus coruscus TaxID=42192 RepID=A0A6J8B4X9_MYTCO|nr:unnamed protein product [Mytilus coruscus]